MYTFRNSEFQVNLHLPWTLPLKPGGTFFEKKLFMRGDFFWKIMRRGSCTWGPIDQTVPKEGKIYKCIFK